MAFRKERHPDMNLNEIDYSITYQVCQNFDIDRSWEQLAGVIGYSTSHIQTFELETRRPDGSPTKKVLWDWGSRGATLRDLYNKLNLINKTQTMRLLEPIMKINEKTEKTKLSEMKEKDEDCDNSSIMTKDDNLSVSSNNSMASSSASMLPIPQKKPAKPSSYSNVDVNLNTSDSKSSKPSEKDKQKMLGMTGMGTDSVKLQECYADGPASGPGNQGAGASSARSFERVKSVVDEYDSASTLYMSQLSTSEKEIAKALIAIPHYTYKELSQATEGFSTRYLIGEGKFGKVYKGRVKNTEYAIKKLFQRPNTCAGSDTSGQLAGELKSLSRYRHENIVSLYAYALDGDEICLVYQYMHNGSLEDCLHRNNGKQVLTWEQRVIILRGAACGLQFLHSVDPKPVIHGDIKSSNILLDRHKEAKIGDLGIAQQATGGDVTGIYTHITKKNTGIQDYKNRAYLAPEISRGNGSSLKGDAYAFGVIMFECLSGQQAYDSRREGSADEKNLVVYIENYTLDHPKCNKQKAFEDQRLDASFPQEVFTSLCNTAERCTMSKKKDRPSMIEVYKVIETTEASHSEVEYCNIKGMKMSTDTPKLQDLPLKKQTSSDENTPIGVESQLVKMDEVRSPVDYLPADQLPQSVKLQLEVDLRKEMSKGCDYVNVSKLRDVPQIFQSDPKKLAEIEKCDNNFNVGSMKKQDHHGRSVVELEIGKQMVEIKKEVNANEIDTMQENKQKNSVKVESADEKISCEESHDYVNAPGGTKHVENPPNFVQGDKVDLSKALDHDYVNVAVEIGDKDKFTQLFTEPVHDFDAELELIKTKAAKPNSSMMDIFNRFDNAKEEEIDEGGFDDAEFEGPYDDYMDFQFDFDQEGSGSDCSTLKLSQSDSEKMDSFHLSDVRDEDLFACDNKDVVADTSNEGMINIENRTGQINLCERDAGENEEACSLEMDNGNEQSYDSLNTSLEKHRMKQAQYANFMDVNRTQREGDMMVDDLIARKGQVLEKIDNVNGSGDETTSQVKGPPGVYPGLKVEQLQGPRVPSESEYVYV